MLNGVMFLWVLLTAMAVAFAAIALGIGAVALFQNR